MPLRKLPVALLALLALLIVLPLVGCGGGSRPAAGGADAGRKVGSLTVSLVWPEPSRLIPLASNSVVVQVQRADGTPAAPQIVLNKPTNFVTGQTQISTASFTGLEVGPAGNGLVYRLTATAFPNVGGGGNAQARSAQMQVALDVNNPTQPVTLTMVSTVARVEVQPLNGPSLRIGNTRDLTATCFDASNTVVLVDPSTIQWSNDNTLAGNLSATTGATVTFTAVTAGETANIRATYTEPDPDVVSPPAVVVVAQKGLADTGWAKFRGNPQNTGQAGPLVTGNATTGTQRWEFFSGDSIVFASAAVGPVDPATGDWNVYIGSYDNVFYCLDGKTGTERWSYLTGGPIESSPAISKDGTVYFGSNDGFVYALDTATGAEIWKFQLDGPVFGSPTLGPDGGLYVGTARPASSFYKLDARTGTQSWRTTVGGGVESSPALSPDATRVYFGCTDGNIYGLSTANGATAAGWPVATGDVIFACSPAVDGAGNVYIGSLDGRLYARTSGGAALWTFNTGVPIVASPALVTSGSGAATRVYVATYDNVSGNRDSHLIALSGSGTELWRFPGGSGGDIDLVSSSPAIGRDGTVYFGSNNQNIYAIDPSGTQRWVRAAGDIVESSPAIGPDGTLYFGCWNGRVIAVR